MKVFALIVVSAGIAVVAWRLSRDSDAGTARLERLRAAIDRSALPPHARDEVRVLLDNDQLRPSQYLADD